MHGQLPILKVVDCHRASTAIDIGLLGTKVSLRADAKESVDDESGGKLLQPKAVSVFQSGTFCKRASNMLPAAAIVEKNMIASATG